MSLLGLVFLCGLAGAAFDGSDDRAHSEDCQCGGGVSDGTKTNGTGVFCAQNLQHQFQDSGGTTHYVYGGQSCDNYDSCTCSGTGHTSDTQLAYPTNCTDKNCAPARAPGPDGRRHSVQKGHKMSKAGIVAKTEDFGSAHLLAHFYVRFNTPGSNSRVIHAKLSLVKGRYENHLYLTGDGYQIPADEAPNHEFDAGVAKQPDSGTQWYVIEICDVTFHVIATDGT
jgi:hypothetical protein